MDHAIKNANGFTVHHNGYRAPDQFKALAGKILDSSADVSASLGFLFKGDQAVQVHRSSLDYKDIVGVQNTNILDQADGLKGSEHQIIIFPVFVELGSKVGHGLQIFPVRKQLQGDVVLDLLGLHV